MLARRSDINLTMNVYTMLAVTDQAVETLPPVPALMLKAGTRAAPTAWPAAC